MIPVDEPLPGVYLLQPKVFNDDRGEFVKTFDERKFLELGLDFKPVEEFFSTSRRGVLRGMHFQLPPHDHTKLVYCIRGRILDVVVDLRKARPTYGKCAVAELSERNRQEFYLPPGVAHGFLALEENNVVVYKTTRVHAPSHDAGILWNSFGFDWGLGTPPILSLRDQAFPALSEFVSPFR